MLSLLVFLVVAALPMTRSVSLSSRLNRIYSLCKNSKIIADVGSDHGLLALKLASNEHVNHVYCIDNSMLALKNGIYQNMQKFDNEVKNRLEIRNGDGLSPIVKEKKKVETVILAGLGAHTINSILNVDLAALGCKQVIIQPFPCNFKDLLPLYQSILNQHSKWSISDMAIDYEKRQFYLTSVFSHVPEQASNNHENLLTLNDFPLHKIEDKSVLFKYLKKQQDLLTVKRQGFVHDGVDGTAEYKYLLLILKQIEGMLPTDRT